MNTFINKKGKNWYDILFWTIRNGLVFNWVTRSSHVFWVTHDLATFWVTHDLATSFGSHDLATSFGSYTIWPHHLGHTSFGSHDLATSFGSHDLATFLGSRDLLCVSHTNWAFIFGQDIWTMYVGSWFGHVVRVIRIDDLFQVIIGKRGERHKNTGSTRKDGDLRDVVNQASNSTVYVTIWNRKRPRTPVQRQRTMQLKISLLWWIFKFSVAVRPQRPYGLLGTGSPGGPPPLSHSFWGTSWRMHFSCSWYTLYLLECHVRVTAADSGLCCCVSVWGKSFKRWLTPLCVCLHGSSCRNVVPAVKRRRRSAYGFSQVHRYHTELNCSPGVVSSHSNVPPVGVDIILRWTLLGW